MGVTNQRAGFTFGLPPSLGVDPVWALAREFADLLSTAGFTTVIPYKTYQELQLAVLAGSVDAAWGPPLTCARIESVGGSVAFRGIRGGATSYRSALVSRIQDTFDIAALGVGVFRPRVAWVDDSSVGGYLLPRAYLRDRGIDVQTAFLNQRMLGSYSACIDALFEFESDLTAVFVRPGGLAETWGARAPRLKVLAFTKESPNDGVVISPSLSPARAKQLVSGLEALITAERSRAMFTSMFNVEDFDTPPKGTYIPLLSFL
ncbi:MAG: PhnD/SsuA/transferrin family substrate-binding protein [Deltaproteobacteria bacterium]|nr:PhnD/SsuA/transferrin family substrate-binding protein [Deltaproteobacteria bacterium]